MKIFITGVYSFVGQELVRQCKARGIEWVGVDLFESQEKNYYKADIRDPKIADIIPEGIDALVHLAAMSRDGDCKNKAYECFDSNVMGTLNLINAAHQRKVKQFVFASTEWVYDSFKEGEIKDEDSVIDISKINSEYALSKLVSENNLRQKYAHGFCPATILRFGIIYGPREKNWSAVESLFNTVKNKDEVAVGAAKSGRCFIHVSDIVAGIIASLGLQGFHILNLQGERLITLGEVIRVSKEILKRDPRIVEKDPTNVSVRLVSNVRAKDTLNWRPTFDLKSGVETLQVT